MRHLADIFTVHPLQFPYVDLCGRGFAAGELEGIDHFLAGHHFAVIAGRPAEQCEVVEECFAKEPFFFKVANKGVAVAFGIGFSLAILSAGHIFFPKISLDHFFIFCHLLRLTLSYLYSIINNDNPVR